MSSYNSNYLHLEKKIEAVPTAVIPNTICCTDVATGSPAGFSWHLKEVSLDVRVALGSGGNRQEPFVTPEIHCGTLKEISTT